LTDCACWIADLSWYELEEEEGCEVVM
jgi:hypothetical protein